MNMDSYTDRLLQLLEGKLDANEEAMLRSEIDSSSELQEELDRLQEMRVLLEHTIKETSGSAMKPFLTDRIMRQLEPSSTQQIEHDDLAFFLTRLFRPVALAGFVIAMFLAVYNVNISGAFSTEATTAEAILALPPVNTMAVYDLDLFVEGDPTATSSLP